MTNTLWHSCKFNKSTSLIVWLKPGFGSLDIHPSQLDERRVGDGGRNPPHPRWSARSRAMSLEDLVHFLSPAVYDNNKQPLKAVVTNKEIRCK